MAMLNLINFSVLIPVYDGERSEHFSRALASIVEQTLLPTEVVLVKDGPLRAELEKVISCYASRYSFFKIIPLQEHLGLGEALRRGLEACNFDIVVRMDSDDISCRKRFEVQVPYLYANKNIAVLGAGIEEFHRVPGDTGRIRKVPTSPDRIKSYSKFRCPVNHPTAVFRKTAIISVGSYKNMLLFEDYYLWMRLLRKGYLIENLPLSLLHFRVTEETVKRRQGIGYFRKELFFFKRLKSEKLISSLQYITLLATRLPVRLLPNKLCGFVYNQLLR